jgi:hypothetical protein
MASVIGYSAPINLKALPATSSLNDTDLVLIQVGGQLQAITKADLASALGGGGSEAGYASFILSTEFYGYLFPLSPYTQYRNIPASSWTLEQSSVSTFLVASGDNFVFGETGVYNIDLRLNMFYQTSYTDGYFIVNLETGNDTDGWSIVGTFYDQSIYNTFRFNTPSRSMNYIYRVSNTTTDQFRIRCYVLYSGYGQARVYGGKRSMVNVHRIGDLIPT